MLDMNEVTAALISPVSQSDSEVEMQGESESNSDMMCSLLMKMGGIDAKLDMLLAAEKEDMKEDEAESEASDGMLALPMGSQASALTAISYDGFPMP